MTKTYQPPSYRANPDGTVTLLDNGSVSNILEPFGLDVLGVNPEWASMIGRLERIEAKLDKLLAAHQPPDHK